MNVFLNSYHPLCKTKKGRQAAKCCDYPLFVDGSIRREPDFENLNPAITNLCRPNKLIKRLEKGSLVVYMTTIFNSYKQNKHWRLVAVLEVETIVDSHKDAEKWYLDHHKEDVSQNIICDSTEALSIESTSQIPNKHYLKNGKIDQNKWDKLYQNRARNYPKVAICNIWNNIMELSEPKTITRDDMIEIFDKQPGTQNPRKFKSDEWQKFQKIVIKGKGS
ncbi:MAG: hypothetical protein ABUK01_00515 [Leptospirales bacterium]